MIILPFGMKRTELFDFSDHFTTCWSALNTWHKDQLETGIWTGAVRGYCASELGLVGESHINKSVGSVSQFLPMGAFNEVVWYACWHEFMLSPHCPRKSTYEPLEGHKDGLHFPLTASSLMFHRCLCLNGRVPAEPRDEPRSESGTATSGLLI